MSAVAAGPRAGRSDRDLLFERELRRRLRWAERVAPVVELRPSEFAAARRGLEADPVLLRMVDRLVDGLRLYADGDDGGVRARVVLAQWIRYRNYADRVRRGELPAPRLSGPAEVE